MSVISTMSHIGIMRDIVIIFKAFSQSLPPLLDLAKDIRDF